MERNFTTCVEMFVGKPKEQYKSVSTNLVLIYVESIGNPSMHSQNTEAFNFANEFGGLRYNAHISLRFIKMPTKPETCRYYALKPTDDPFPVQILMWAVFFSI